MLFESTRLRFRTLRDEDLPQLHAWWSDPEIRALQTRAAIRLRSFDADRRTIEAWFAETMGGAAFAIELKASGELIGCCRLAGASFKDRDAELALLLGRKELWGQELGPEATLLLLQYGFGELGLHRVHLHVLGTNRRAVRAYEKAGFVREGCLRESVFRGGHWHDELVMGILARELQGQEPVARSAPA